MASTARGRRLQAEFAEMCALREATSLVTFSAEGTPPTRYEIRLSCGGLCLDGDRVTFATSHAFDILLGQEFPLFTPNVVWKTPIFHPNFKGSAVCMGDFWYPAWSLAEMCVALCEMVQYKTFNIYDPLDHEAAFWLMRELDERPESFPVDRRPVRDLDFSIAITKNGRPNGLEED